MLPIEKIIVFGVKKASGRFDVTILFKDRLHHDKNHMDFAHVIDMAEDDLYDDDILEFEISKCMRGMSWNVFVSFTD